MGQQTDNKTITKSISLDYSTALSNKLLDVPAIACKRKLSQSEL